MTDATATGPFNYTIRVESEGFATRVGLRIPALTRHERRQYRLAYVGAKRAYNPGEIPRPMRSWTLPFLIRHSALHPSTTRGRWRTRTSGRGCRPNYQSSDWYLDVG